MPTPDSSLPPYRLIVADDHELARSGLRAMLEGAHDLQVVGEATNGIEAVELCERERPDLALLDLRMPQLDGLGAARAIRRRCPGTRIVMVTLHESAEYLEQGFRAGASGYIVKDASRIELLTALRAVLRGDAHLSTALANLLVQRLGEPPASAGNLPQEVLTARETQVLGLIVQGLTNKEIAQRLSIAPGTVKIHVERLIGKLGVADRTQAAVRAIERGLVSRPSS